MLEHTAAKLSRLRSRRKTQHMWSKNSQARVHIFPEQCHVPRTILHWNA